jgi:CDP-glycerol glycerophosphotransferase (TagB/SpsB family)
MKQIDKENFSYKVYIKFFVLLIYIPIKYLIYLIPRKKEVWVFGEFAGRRYADNSKSLFKWVNKNQPNISAIWITKSKSIKCEVVDSGYSCYLAYEPKGILYGLIAKVYVYCCTSSDINHWTSFGAIKVNLWHGTPLKLIGRDIESKQDRDYKAFNSKGLKRIYYQLVFPGFFEFPDILCSASKNISNRLMSAFDLTEKKVQVTGYPRNDQLFERQKVILGAGKLLNLSIKERRKIVTYLPTYRERVEQPFFLDWNQLNEVMRECASIFVIKFHPFDKTTLDLDQYEFIEVLESSVDIYPLLSVTDILISDYSSVVFDYLLLDRPIIYFVYDLKEYVSVDRSLYETFESTVAGDITGNSDELIVAIKKNLTTDKNKVERRRMSVKYNDFIDGNSSKRVFSKIIKLIHD